MGVIIPSFVICITAAGLSFPVSSQVPTIQSVAAQTANSASNTRLPYMAKYRTTQVRTLPDGSAMTHETTEVVAVDSHGRRMTAITKTPPPGGQARTHIMIVDPVAHTNISWMSPGTEATVSAIPLDGAYGCSYSSFSMGGPSVKTKDEDLGTATIQGVEARGRRFSKTISLGPREKNQTLLNMVEVWTAVDPGLSGMLVRRVNDDAGSGQTTKDLVSFRQAEPDPSMFRFPVGYEIVNREVSPSPCPDIE